MAMYIIDRSYIYSEAHCPDFSGWENKELEAMCNSIFSEKMADRLYDWAGLHWFPETGEVGAEGGSDMDPDEIQRWFEDARNQIADKIIEMSEGEIRTAYNELSCSEPLHG